MFESYLESLNVSDIINNVEIQDTEIRVGHIIGLGAVILNGFSYHRLEGNVTYLCNCKELDGLSTGTSKMIYIENYREPDFGFDNHVSTPERTICDFLMYPVELKKDLYLLDIIEGYYEEYGNFDKVYEMLDHFGIPHTEFDEYVEVAEI